MALRKSPLRKRFSWIGLTWIGIKYVSVWRRQWHPTPLLLPGKFHGWRSLVSYSPWDRKGSHTTEQLHWFKQILLLLRGEYVLIFNIHIVVVIIQFSSVAQSCPSLCDPMNRSTPGLPVHHQLPEFTQILVHWVSNAIQPSHPLLSASSPAPNPSQQQSLFQWVNSLHQVAKVLEFQLQHQSFQRIFRVDFL